MKGKFSDISRPVNDSFRHTGHGSILGNSWGSPSFLDPQFMGDEKNVQIRGMQFIWECPFELIYKIAYYKIK